MSLILSIATAIVSLTISTPTGITATPTKHHNICHTEKCYAEAANIKNKMNESADPCNDFFQYACGGWMKNNPLPEGKGELNQFGVVEQRTRSLLKELLEAPATQQDREAIKKAKSYYKACINETFLNQADLSGLWSWIENIGGMILFGDGTGEFQLESFLTKAITRHTDFWRYISSPIMNLAVYADDKNIDVNVISIDQPLLVLPSPAIYQSDNFASLHIAYKRLMADILTAIWKYRDTVRGQDTVDDQKIEKMANEIFEMERDLGKILQPSAERLRYLNLYNKMTLKDASTKLSNKFDWLKYVQESFSSVDIEITPETEIISYGNKYFKSMMDVLENYDPSVIQAYVVLYNAIEHVDLLSKKYRDLASDFRGNLTGDAIEKPRESACVSKTAEILPRPVGALYVKNVFSEDSKQEVIDMHNKISIAVKEKIAEITWADDVTKDGLNDMLDHVSAQIGYPDEIIDENNPILDEELDGFQVVEDQYFTSHLSLCNLHLKRLLMKAGKPTHSDEWFVGAAEVNAYYNYQRNTMIFPAAILQPPFYNADRPTSMKFGAIGTIVGWMLTSVISNSREFDTSGKLGDWWTKNSSDNFDKIETCFTDLYSSFYDENAKMLLNGKSNKISNMNDNGALRKAYYGYMKWAESNSDEFVLPGFDNVAPEKLFFLANAQIWCGIQNEASAKSTVAEGYTTFLFRSHGPLRNFEEFGKLFDCQQDSDALFPKRDDMCMIM